MSTGDGYRGTTVEARIGALERVLGYLVVGMSLGNSSRHQVVSRLSNVGLAPLSRAAGTPGSEQKISFRRGSHREQPSPAYELT